jgi:hypothetical protein
MDQSDPHMVQSQQRAKADRLAGDLDRAKARQSNFSLASLSPIGRRRVHHGRISNQLRDLLLVVPLLPSGRLSPVTM